MEVATVINFHPTVKNFQNAEKHPQKPITPAYILRSENRHRSPQTLDPNPNNAAAFPANTALEPGIANLLIGFAAAAATPKPHVGAIVLLS